MVIEVIGVKTNCVSGTDVATQWGVGGIAVVDKSKTGGNQIKFLNYETYSNYSIILINKSTFFLLSLILSTSRMKNPRFVSPG